MSRGSRPAVAGLAAAAVLALPVASSAAAPDRFPAGRSFAGLPWVGALFIGPNDRGEHACTASVVDSPGGDLVLTAAHCVAGTGVGLTFVPGYHDGVAPYGSWPVEAAYVTTAWQKGENPQDDFAFLRLAPQTSDGRTVSLQSLVGGVRLATGLGFRLTARVVGYPAALGSGDPISCTTRTYRHQGYLAVNCDGYVDGTSGGPFLVGSDGLRRRGLVDGVIGGLHQGGCYSYTSYSSYFGPTVRALYLRAVAGGPGDVVPPLDPDDGC